jgi:pimeloyl-ACP methyl ester carboxylesterase
VNPSTVESFARGADDTRLYVRQRPREGALARSTVTSVLCDGILCDGFIWKYLWDELAQLGDVVHWHYRGHGRSEAPRDPSRVDIEAHAADLDAVRRHVGDPPVVLFGHSMGCQVALEGWRHRRENVRGLVLLCGSFGKVTQTFRGTNLLAQVLPVVSRLASARPELTRAIWSRVPRDISLKTALLLGEIDPRTIRPEDVLPYLEHMTHVDFPMFLRMLEHAGEHSAEDVLASIDVPVLLIAGEVDAWTPPHLAELMAREIPDAELVVVPGGTHVTPLEHRDLVRERVERFFADRVRA